MTNLNSNADSISNLFDDSSSSDSPNDPLIVPELTKPSSHSIDSNNPPNEINIEASPSSSRKRTRQLEPLADIVSPSASSVST